MRPIDADALIDKYQRECTIDVFRYEVLDDLNNAPTIDAVPVIRCYECKYFREFEKGFSTDWDGSCKYWNTHSTVYSNFCGCAKRKEE